MIVWVHHGHLLSARPGLYTFILLCCCFSFIFSIISSFPQPKVVTDTDETELARQLERLERENAEVDGDDDAEEMEAKAED